MVFFFFRSGESILHKSSFKYLIKIICLSLAVLQDILEIHKNMEATVRDVTAIITDSWLAVTT